MEHLSEMYERFFEDELFSGKYHSFMEVHFEEKRKEKDLAFLYQMVGELVFLTDTRQKNLNGIKIKKNTDTAGTGIRKIFKISLNIVDSFLF